MASLRVQLKDMSTMCDICCALVKNDTIVKVQRCPLWPSVMAQRCAHAESYIPQRRKLNHAAKTYDDPKFSFVNALSTLSQVLENILYFNKQHRGWNSSVEEIPCCDSGEYSSTSCSVAELPRSQTLSQSASTPNVYILPKRYCRMTKTKNRSLQKTRNLNPAY